ncbi:isopentenyl-diphosphate Delta-isomerase [Youngiibacter fragilis]|uniref:Isopentenyl-diphosphate delta-isomerase n=1 Tax=Youngiibacter fragilis 232.1 TaxID=994573 RepID=V7I4J5_9CLOT|nr:isopentenyl-diphosphate Delta-isomerase [Youngiibacter fragilis]ETA80216.1 isopentenyl-diphosphate delta-isomerase [Youngiibacter fragilis 232.1]
MEMVILVDEKDNEEGSMEKMEAHVRGVKHRAFSVFVFDSEGRLLLQRRALDKYHSGGLWTNTCCSHPRPDETSIGGAHRRLIEEMGFDAELEHAFELSYEVRFDSGVWENEYDHVFVGWYDGNYGIDSNEVHEARWIPIPELRAMIVSEPQVFTHWFRLIMENEGFLRHIENMGISI